jgi:hypothetical protein
MEDEFEVNGLSTTLWKNDGLLVYKGCDELRTIQFAKDTPISGQSHVDRKIMELSIRSFAYTPSCLNIPFPLEAGNELMK